MVAIYGDAEIQPHDVPILEDAGAWNAVNDFLVDRHAQNGGIARETMGIVALE